MPRLIFACPSTGMKFASGIQTDEHSLASVSHMPVTLQCPLCGKTHRVTVKSGHLEDSPPASPPARAARTTLHSASPTPELTSKENGT